MAIKDLIEYLGKQNIADDFEDDILDELGEQVLRRFQEDVDSMKDWVEMVNEGADLMKQEFRPKSTPFPNSSNFKTPMLSEASIQFGDKATLEILRARNLVKADIVGKDKQGIKKATAERVTEAMNYQVNYQMPEWRNDQERMFYTLPNVGCMFKKTVFDPLENRTVSHVIQYPDFAVNQATTNIDNCRSFTQILDVDRNGVNERQSAGIWSDVEIYNDDAEGDEGSNEAAETVNADENPDRFLEQQCFADLDSDGIDEPYIVTIHESTKTVVRIIPRYNERSFIVKTPQGAIQNMVEVFKERAVQNALRQQPQPEIEDIKGLTLVRIEPVVQITKFGFIPAPDGTFLDLGYPHLMGAIAQLVNTTTNQLVDAGRMRNVGGGFLAKGFRKKMGPVNMGPGKYQQTDIPADKMHGAILPNPSPEPSQVLFALNEKIEQQGRNLTAIVDASGQITANTAPTTALAIIQESLISTSALMGRMLKAMSNEFQILYRIDQTSFDPELYQVILDEKADVQADFNNQSLDIKPTASPEMSSKLQRIQLATVEMEQLPNVIQSGGNPMPIVKGFFKNVGSDKVEDIWPEEPTPQQQEEMQRFTAAQEQANQIEMENLRYQKLQTDILMREQARLDAKTMIDIEKAISDITKNRADNILTLEKAESEDVKNQISKYTTQQQGVIDLLTAIGAEDVRARTSTNARQAQIPANQPRPV